MIATVLGCYRSLAFSFYFENLDLVYTFPSDKLEWLTHARARLSFQKQGLRPLLKADHADPSQGVRLHRGVLCYGSQSPTGR